MIAERIRVLLVDNQVTAREWLAEWLRQHFDVQTAGDGMECLEKVAEANGNYDVIVMDLRLGRDPDGVETMKEVKKKYPAIETIIMTGFIDSSSGKEAVKAGAYRYITKPFDNEEIVVYIERAAEKRKLLSEISRAQVYETFTALRSGLNLEEILDGIVEKLQTLFNLTTCTIALLDAKKTYFEIVAERGLGRKIRMAVSELPKDFTKIFEYDRPLEIIDLDQRPDWKACLLRPDLKSLTLLPLKDSNGGVLGGLTMGRLYPTNHSSPEEIRLLMGLADQASIAIENARLHEQTKKRAALLAALDDAALYVVAPLEVEEVLRRTIEGACKLLQAPGGTVYQFTPDKRKLRVTASYGHPFIEEGIIITRDKGVVGEVIKSNKPFSKSDYASWPGRQKLFDELGLQAVMGVPISYGEKPLGVLALHHTEPAMVFDEEQEKSLVKFGGWAGIALGRAQELEEQKLSGGFIQTLVSELSELADERLHEKILGLLRKAWPQGFCEILIRKQDTNELYVVATDFPVREVRKTPIKISRKNGVVGWVAATGTPKVVFDVREDENYREILPQTKSEIAVPLLCEKKVLGVINIESPAIGEFNERDERVLMRLATAIAVRVNQSQQIEEAKREIEQSQSMARFLNDIGRAETLPEKLSIVAKKVLSDSNADFCLVLLPTRDGHNMRVRAVEVVEQRVTWGEVMGKLCTMLEIPQIAEVLLASHKIFTREDPLEAQIIEDITERAELKETLKTILLIPLKEGPFGGLCMLGEVEGRTSEVFTVQRILSAVTTVDNVSPLIHTARKMELEQKRNEVFRDLTAVGSLVTSTLEKHKVFDLIVEYCRTLLKAEVCAIFVVRRAGYLTLESSIGSPEGTANIGLRLPIWDGKDPVKYGLTGFLAAKGEIFNEYGDTLSSHPAIKSLGPHPHLPTGFCQSLLAVPLKKKTVAGKDEVIGLIKVENKKDQTGRVDNTRGFTNEDVLVLTTLASFAVTAIQNAEHFAFASGLERVAREVNSSVQNYGDVLERVFVELRQLIPFTSASIQRRHGNLLKVKACHGFNEREKEEVLKLTFPLIPTFPNERVIRTRRPYRIDDIRSTRFEHFWKEKMYCGAHVRSWLGIPLVNGDDLIGMLAMESDQPSFYTSRDEENAEAFASQVVPAIINAELYKSADSFIQITRELNSETGRTAVLQKIVDLAIDKNAIIGADKAIIYDYDSELVTFNSPAVHAGGLVDPAASNPPFMRTSVVFRCTKLKRPYLQPNIAGCKLLNANFTRREKIVSAAVFPLLVDGELVGLMFINYLNYHCFTKREVEAMELFAQQAAIAIKKARQLEKLKQRMETAAAAARIGRLAATFAHDVRNPALTIQFDVNSLRKVIDDPDTMAILDDIYTSAEHITKAVPHNLPMNHEPENVDLLSVIQRILQRREEELAHSKVSVVAKLDGMPTVLMNTQWMEWIIDRLINNALRFMNGGGTITFSGEVLPKRVKLDVIDSGPGVAPHLREQLYIGKVIDPDSSGQGWSLLIIKSVLNDFNGDISYPYMDHRGNVFAIDLPLALPPEVNNSDAEGTSPHS
jgi:GAF domain-containing protein/ActR/RegA family two-component response regulator